MTDNGSMIPDDELISAYHDGELNEVDRARAERLLSADPERRRELAELQALSRRVQSLPSKSLGDNFAAEVLRRAERELLAPAQAAEVDEPPVSDARRGWSWRPGRRGLMWAGAALAASVLLMLWGPRVEHELAVMTAKPTATIALQPAEEVLVESAPAAAVSNVPRYVSMAKEARGAASSEESAPQSRASLTPRSAGGSEPRTEFDVAAQLEHYGFATPVNRHLAQQAAVVETLNPTLPVDASLWVVEVDIERQQIAADPFAQVLLDNGVQCATLPQVQRANLDNNLYQSQLARRNLSRDAQHSLALGDTDLVYVVAEPSQLQAAITQLQAGRATYRRVAITAPANLSLTDEYQGEADKNLAGEKRGLERRTLPQAKLAEPELRDAKQDAMKRKQPDADHDQPAGLDRAKDGTNAAARSIQPEMKSTVESLGVAAKEQANGALAKTENESLAGNSWFGRLTLPPADAPQLKQYFYAERQVGKAHNQRGPGAAGLPAQQLGASQLKDAPSNSASADAPPAGKPQADGAAQPAAPRAPSPAAVAAEDFVGQQKKQSTLSEPEQRRDLVEKNSAAMPQGQPPLSAPQLPALSEVAKAANPAALQRALFVFRVVDSSAASTPAAAPAPTAATAPVVPAAAAPVSKPASPPTQPAENKTSGQPQPNSKSTEKPVP